MQKTNVVCLCVSEAEDGIEVGSFTLLPEAGSRVSLSPVMP